MTATSHNALRSIFRLAFVLLAAFALAGVAATVDHTIRAARQMSRIDDVDGDLQGRDERQPDNHLPTVQAAFDAQSYRSGTAARLVLFDSARNVTVQLYRVGAIRGPLRSYDRMRGTAVGQPLHLASVVPGQAVQISLGKWPSGLYYARLTEAHGHAGYATFVVRPRRLGEHRVAVVLPTNTWQAYNFFDGNGDGLPDSWYANPHSSTVSPLPAVPRRRRAAALVGLRPRLRPLARRRAQDADFLTDDDLERIATGDALAKAYDLIVFSGHEEYVTTHEYDVVQRYRDLGGNLAFLSANNFFYRVDRRGGTITRDGRWRDLGRPEAALIGAQYYENDQGEHRGGWTVRSTPASRWIFAGTGVAPGSLISSGGIEADEVEGASPRNVQVLAEIRNLFGDRHNAQMSYYTTKAGAKVFAAGAFSLAGSVWQPTVTRMMLNLITVLSEP